MATTDSEPAVATTPEPTDALTRDEIFDVLSSRRRRYALHYLRRQENERDGNGRANELGSTDGSNGDGGVALSELAERVAAWENDRTIEELSAAERKRAYTSLQQFHLPRLDEQRIVEYDRRNGVVSLGEAMDDIDVYLDVVPRKDVPWSLYYLGLSVLGAVLVGGVALGVSPFDLLSAVAWGTFLVTTLLVSSVVHLYDSRRMKLGANDTPPEIGRP
ncbi:hypothetical protein BRC86_10860 [Halobacteriales archaeon QS_3_64_16]|nr:MAG: hypothetical protein BRC86_10860 [Halobacteriales archaeon QS_3_64_16]